MTRKEQEVLQKFCNRMSKYEAKADDAFKMLQDLNEKEGTGKRWCSAEQNVKDLLSVGKDYMYLYNEYVRADAAIDTLMALGSELADIGFWKNK